MSRFVGEPTYDEKTGTLRIMFQGDWAPESSISYEVMPGWRAYVDPEGRHLRGYEFPEFPKHAESLLKRRVEFPTFPLKLRLDGKEQEVTLYGAFRWAIDKYLPKPQAPKPAAGAPAAKAAAPGARPAAAAAAAPAPAATAVAEPPVDDAPAAMYDVTYHAAGVTRTVKLPHGFNLLDGAIEHEIPVDFDCKAGVCDTCQVEIVRGGENMSPPTDEEKIMLGEEAVARGSRLSCQVLVHGPMEVRQNPH